MRHEGRWGERVDRLVAIDKCIESRPDNVDGGSAKGRSFKQVAIGNARYLALRHEQLKSGGAKFVRGKEVLIIGQRAKLNSSRGQVDVGDIGLEARTMHAVARRGKYDFKIRGIQAGFRQDTGQNRFAQKKTDPTNSRELNPVRFENCVTPAYVDG